MYGFNQLRGNEKTLCGCELIQVSFGLHEVIFRFFPEDAVITTTSVQRLFRDNYNLYKAMIIDGNFPLLGLTISEVQIVSNECVRVQFANDFELTLVDDDPDFEVIDIKTASKRFIV